MDCDGITSNPAIFEKAIAGSSDYELQLKDLTRRRDLDAKSALRDPGRRRHPDVADILKPVHQSTGGVTATSAWRSRPISPTTPRAHWTRRGGSGRRVSRAERDDQGAGHAGRHPRHRGSSIADGININVTLLFSMERLRGGGRGVPRGLEPRSRPRAVIRSRRERGELLHQPHRRRHRRAASRRASGNGQQLRELQGHRGRVAIANAKLAYQRYKEIFIGARWAALAGRGARCPAPAVGQHRHQEPELPRRALRRDADRPGHRQHHAARHLRRVPGSRPPAPQPRGGCRGRAPHDGLAGRERHLDEAGDGPAPGGRLQDLRGRLRQAAGRRRQGHAHADRGGPSARPSRCRPTSPPR